MKLQNINLLNLQSNYMKSDATTIAMCYALDNQIKRLTDDIKQLLILSNIDGLGHDVLNELAWQFHVDEYDTSYSLEIKRTLIKNALQFHKYAGTKYACEMALKSIFGEGSKIEEWFQYGGEPFNFRVKTTNIAATNEMAEQFKRALKATKNARSILEAIIVEMSADMDLYYGGVWHIGEYIYI